MAEKCSFRWCDFDASRATTDYRAEATGSSEFMCEYHFAEYSRFMTHPTPGLDPKTGASDFWRPSLTEMIRHAGMEMNRQERAQQAPAQSPARDILERERHLSPAQHAQLMFIRAAFTRQAGEKEHG